MFEDIGEDWFESDYDDFYEGTEYAGFYDDLDDEDDWLLEE